MPDISRPLVVVDRFPLPAVTGGRQRMWNFLLAIASIGPADLLILEASDREAEALLAAALPTWTLRCVAIPKRRVTKVMRLVQILRNGPPSGLAKLDFGAAETSIGQIAQDRRLIVAIQPIAAVLALRVHPESCAVLVDLWDIEDARLARLSAAREGDSASRSPRRAWDNIRDKSDIRAWRRFHEQLVTDSDAVTVCSDVDRHAMPPSTKIYVVPNGADRRADAPRPLHQPPVILYHGQMTYAPNAYAARILVEEILPVIRKTLPDITVRIVGRADNRVLRLASPPHVVVTGFVDDIDAELAGADVLVVPLRVGGGTRLKILEAFSARLPVVSTTIGAEGLDLESGTHLWIEDDSGAIASKALALLVDDGARERLTAAAYELIERQYDWTIIRGRLADLVRSLTNQPATGC